MEMLNPDIWKQQWAVFVSAPYIIGSFIAGAGLIGWWLRGIKSGRETDGLKGEIAGLKGEIGVLGARLKFADERMAWASEVKDKGDKAIETARQFEDLKAQIIAHGAIAAWANEVKDNKAFEELKAQIISNLHGAIAERLAEVTAAAEKLSVANSAAQSAIAIAVGASAADRERRNGAPLELRVG